MGYIHPTSPETRNDPQAAAVRPVSLEILSGDGLIRTIESYSVLHCAVSSLLGNFAIVFRSPEPQEILCRYQMVGIRKALVGLSTIGSYWLQFGLVHNLEVYI